MTFYFPENRNSLSMISDSLEIKSYMQHMGWHDADSGKGLPEKVEACAIADIVIVQFPLCNSAALALGAAIALSKPVIVLSKSIRFIQSKKGNLHPLCQHPRIYERIIESDLLIMCALAHKKSKKAVRKSHEDK